MEVRVLLAEDLTYPNLCIQCIYNNLRVDQAKATSTQKKHGVSFEEARSVFYDEFAVQFFDDENSEFEDRFLMLGFSDEARLLIVCHCERENGNVIRIISARKAMKKEGKYYPGAKP